LASVFCASDADDDAALHHSAAFLVEHGLEQRPARAGGHGMIDKERSIGMLAAAQQRRGGNSRLFVPARAMHRHAVTRNGGAGAERASAQLHALTGFRQQGR
jgi:hypothetical protein